MVAARRAGVGRLREAAVAVLVEAGASRTLQEAVAHMWSVDAEGKMVLWEEMGWEEWKGRVEQAVGEREEGERDAIAELMGKLAMTQPAWMRQHGWLQQEWTEALHAEGLTRQQAAMMARALVQSSERMSMEMHAARNRVVHGEGAGRAEQNKEVWVRRLWELQDELGKCRLHADLVAAMRIKELRARVKVLLSERVRVRRSRRQQSIAHSMGMQSPRRQVVQQRHPRRTRASSATQVMMTDMWTRLQPAERRPNAAGRPGSSNQHAAVSVATRTQCEAHNNVEASAVMAAAGISDPSRPWRRAAVLERWFDRQVSEAEPAVEVGGLTVEQSVIVQQSQAAAD
jgi:hypothetical protein